MGFGRLICKLYGHGMYGSFCMLIKGELVTEALSKDIVKGLAVFGVLPPVCINLCLML